MHWKIDLSNLHVLNGLPVYSMGNIDGESEVLLFTDPVTVRKNRALK